MVEGLLMPFSGSVFEAKTNKYVGKRNKLGHCSARIQLITIISQDSELKLLEEYKYQK